MDSDTRLTRCALFCWLLAAILGALVATLLLRVADSALLNALFFGGLVMLVSGLVLGRLFCKPTDVVAKPLGAPPRPATPPTPAAVAPIRPAPVPAAAASAPPAPAAAVAAPPAPVGAVAAPPAAVAPPLAPAIAPAAPVTEALKASTAAAPVPQAADGRPPILATARGGTPDDLRVIRGIGPKLQQLLNSMGMFHFDQIAAWTDAELAWVDDNLDGFKGRAGRDHWVVQARVLARGGSLAEAFAAADAAR